MEQTFGILILHRRLVRDYEHRPASTRAKMKRLVTLGILTEAEPGILSKKQ